jgi:hypothetical protein
VDIELEKMVQLIGEGVDGACYRFGDAVVERERAGGFVAGHEGDILEFAETVSDLEIFAVVISLLLLCNLRYCLRVRRR